MEIQQAGDSVQLAVKYTTANQSAASCQLILGALRYALCERKVARRLKMAL